MDEQSIGQQLRQARESRALSLEQVARATHMRVYYLEAMEAGAFNTIPSTAQARGFLRAYADFLRLPAEPLLESLGGPSPAAVPPEPVKIEANLVEEGPPAEGGVSDELAGSIFAEIGQRLRHQRELLGLSLDDVERHTHLRRHNLQALELGRMEDLPSPVQGRGMLKNYAVFLGLDPEALLMRFAEGLQARLAVKQARRQQTRPIPVKRAPTLPAPVRRLLSNDLLIGGLIGASLLIFVLWGAIRIFSLRSFTAPSPTAPSIAAVLLASATATTTPSLAPTETPIPGETQAAFELFPTAETTGDANAQITLPPEAKGSVQVYVTVRQRAWLQATVDGKVEFQGRVLPGSAYTFAGQERVELLTGNAAALQIFFNQQDLGTLGSFGEVVNQVYTREGVETPTPTITPTASPTVRPSPTARPTATPRPGTPTVPALP